jgi:hypothetical protein
MSEFEDLKAKLEYAQVHAHCAVLLHNCWCCNAGHLTEQEEPDRRVKPRALPQERSTPQLGLSDEQA